MMLSWQHSHVSISMMTYEPRKLRQTDLVFVCDHSSSVGLCAHSLYSLYVQRL